MRTISAIIFIILMASSNILKAQVTNGLRFSGYYEPQYMGFDKEDWYQLFSNKFRFNLEKEINSKINFYANFDYITYHGNTTWNLAEFLPDDLATGIDFLEMSGWQQTLYDRSFIDNIYLTLNWAHLKFTAGKQQLSFGSGYVWNPTDIFNIKEMTDPTYEQPGRNALRLDYEWGSNSRFSFVYQPKRNLRESVFYSRIKTTLSHFDLALVGALAPQMIFQKIPFPNGQLAPFTIRRKMIGLDINGELVGVGVYSEAAYFWRNDEKEYLEWVLGADYTFESGLYIMAEYYLNTLFPSDPLKLSRFDWYNFFAGQFKTISRHQIYSMAGFSPTALITIYFSQIVAPSEGSFAFIPMLEYNISDDLTLTAIGQYFTGTHHDVYNRKLGNGVLIRMRLYF